MLPCLILLLLLASRAPAQSTGKDDLSITATIGWNGVVPGDRWAPITVFITAGEQPAQGTITADFAQDPTQAASITVPFAATPQRTTPVTLVAALPSNCDKLTLTIDADGKRTRLEFASGVSRDAIQLPPVLDPSTAVVLAVGRCSLPDAVRDWESLSGYTARKSASEPTVLLPVWGQVSAARAEADSLPNIAAAYRGLSAMVVPGDAARTADRGALEAIREWVQGGGRLVILVDAPGDQWRDWLPEPSRDLVRADTPGVHQLPAGVAEAISQFQADLADPKAARERIEAERKKRPANPYYTPPAASTEEPATSAIVIPGPAARISGRPLRLSEPATRTGWRLGWGSPDDPGAGFLADGPVGLGHVTILGLEPAKASETLSTRASGAVWRTALKPALADFLASAPWQDAANTWSYSNVSQAQSAVNAILENMARVPSVGGWVVVAFAVGLVLLVLLVGPVDYFALKRLHAGQHWWLTALAWTTLGCAIAWAAPTMIRTSPTQVTRTSVVDAILPRGDGSATPAPAWQSALTSIYAGESGVIRPEVDAASWWRGTAAMFNWYRSETRGRGLVPTFQQAAGGAAGSARGNPLGGFGMALWTFRSFMDESRGTVEIGARVKPSDASCEVFVTGLPEGAVVQRGLVKTSHASYAGVAEMTETREGAWKGLLRKDDPDGGSWTLALDIDPQYPQYPQTKPLFRPGLGLSINGPAQRTAPAERLSATGRWATLLLEVRRWPDEPRIDRPAKYEHTRLFRLLVPLDPPIESAPAEPEHPEPEPATPPGTPPS